MAGNDTWTYQGRQSHGWFGHGTAPHAGVPASNRMQGPTLSEGLQNRIRSVIAGSLGHAERGARDLWEATVGGSAGTALAGAMIAWVDHDGLDDEAFRSQFFPPYTSGSVVSDLRAAARSVVGQPTISDLAEGSRQLAGAVRTVGLYRWSRFIADAAARADAKQEQGFVRALRVVDVTGPSAIQRIATGDYHEDLAVVTSRLKGMIGGAIEQANASLPDEPPPTVYGTRVHAILKAAVDSSGIPGLEAEKSFIDGQARNYGEIGTVRTDVTLKDSGGHVVAVWDWKTGINPSLSDARVHAIQEAMGTKYGRVPVLVLRGCYVLLRGGWLMGADVPHSASQAVSV